MALINCIECNKKISSSAQVCPKCGYKHEDFLIDGKVNPKWRVSDYGQALTAETDGTNERERRQTVWFRLTAKERKEIFSDDWSKYVVWNKTGKGLTEKQQDLLEQIDLHKIQLKLIDDFGKHSTLAGRLAVRACLPSRLQRLCEKQKKNNLLAASTSYLSYHKNKSKKQNIKSDNKLSVIGIFYSALIIIMIIIICISYFN